MKFLLKILAIISLFTNICFSRTDIDPTQVAILYNSNVQDSRLLANAYAKARAIPGENIIALPLSEAEEINRSEYEKTIELPLRSHFDKNRWWIMGESVDKTKLAVSSKIKILVTIRGVPLKISRKVPPQLPEGKKVPPPKTPIDGANEASIDSELALLSVPGLPTDGPARNPFYENKVGIIEANMPFMFLVGRIDGPDITTCQRMIQDAIDTEKTGLWGRAYYDLAQFYPDGELWIRTAALQALDYGFLTEIHPWKETYPTNYPMRDVALYFGWYETNACGAFTRAGNLKKGSVAVHLHSFSASTLRSTTAHWCGPLLAQGAAATLGNVYEPYLHLTHRLDLFQKHLLEGYTLVEAAYASIPVVSWQGVILGDPLYRPFKHIDITGERTSKDRSYRALRAAKKMHENNENQYLSELQRIGKERKNAIFLESLAHIHLSKKDQKLATVFFMDAKALYTERADQLRCDLQIIGMHRDNGRKDLAMNAIQAAASIYADAPEMETLKTLRNIIDPPAPPPVAPTGTPNNGASPAK